MTMEFSVRSFLRAAFVLSAISCFIDLARAQEHERCRLNGSQLTDFVRAISKTRFETHKIKPRLARCETFVQLIRERHSDALHISSAADAPSTSNVILSEIAKIIEPKCSGPLNSGLDSLLEFVSDCLELIELSEKASAGSRGVKRNGQQAVGANQISSSQSGELAELKSKLANKVHEVEVLEGKLSKLQGEFNIQSLVGNELKANRDKTIRELSENLNQQQETLNGRIRVKSERISELEREMREALAKEEEMRQELRETNARLNERLRQLQCESQNELNAENYDMFSPNSLHEITIRKDHNGRIGIVLDRSILGGAFVVFVFADSPAARAGFKFGDQVIAINGHLIAGSKTLQSLGDEMTYLVRRSPFEQTLVLDTRKAQVGFKYSNGKVLGVESDSPAAGAGLLREVNMIRVNGKYVVGMSDKEILRALNESVGSETTLSVMPHSMYELLTQWMRQEGEPVRRISEELNAISEEEEFSV